MIRLTIGALALALAFPAHTPLASPIIGPPWISIETPVNPYDTTTKNAFLLVHAFHHGTPIDFPVSGTAEGIVRGERKTVSLEFQTTSRPGVYALKKQWPAEGTWTLLVRVSQGPDDAVSAVVDLGTNGLVAAVQVPTRTENGHTLPMQVSMKTIEESLRTRARVASTRQ